MMNKGDQLHNQRLNAGSGLSVRKNNETLQFTSLSGTTVPDKKIKAASVADFCIKSRNIMLALE